jgi:hypothetical protein
VCQVRINRQRTYRTKFMVTFVFKWILQWIGLIFFFFLQFILYVSTRPFFAVKFTLLGIISKFLQIWCAFGRLFNKMTSTNKFKIFFFFTVLRKLITKERKMPYRLKCLFDWAKFSVICL